MIIMSPSTGGNAHKVNKAVVIDHMEPTHWLIIQTSRGIFTPMIKKNNKFAYHQRSVPVRSALLSPA